MVWWYPTTIIITHKKTPYIHVLVKNIWVLYWAKTPFQPKCSINKIWCSYLITGIMHSYGQCLNSNVNNILQYVNGQYLTVWKFSRYKNPTKHFKIHLSLCIWKVQNQSDVHVYLGVHKSNFYPTQHNVTNSKGQEISMKLDIWYWGQIRLKTMNHSLFSSNVYLLYLIVES